MKTAVILTARKERESDIPYPLLAFDGKQCLIDRTLSILREISVDKIVLIVGYRSELFNKYRSEDVVILKAATYEFTGSMASLAVASDVIDDDFFKTGRLITAPHIRGKVVLSDYSWEIC